MANESKEKRESALLKSKQEPSGSKNEKSEKDEKKKRGGLIEYFKGVKLEMKKVVWPTNKELGSFTVVVLVTCVAFALLFWGIDSGVLAAIRAVCF
ncbi:MAG: preprotein translocase subunit SecE [Bacillota bacterium]|nr:preprotein translocase subunit SecE [Bacillota bacterium]